MITAWGGQFTVQRYHIFTYHICGNSILQYLLLVPQHDVLIQSDMSLQMLLYYYIKNPPCPIMCTVVYDVWAPDIIPCWWCNIGTFFA